MRKVYDNLYVGGIKAPIRSDVDFDRIISLSIDLEETTHKNLILDGEHKYQTFKNAVDDVRGGLKNNEMVLVNCQRGNSRSVSVATVALYEETDLNLYESLSKCKRDDNTLPTNHLLESIIKYTSEN